MNNDAIITAAMNVANLLADPLLYSEDGFAKSLSCDEADTVAALFRACGINQATVADFLAAHGESDNDEDGDRHVPTTDR